MKKNSFINEKVRPKNISEEKACTDIILSAEKDKIKSVRDLLKLKNKICEKHGVSLVTNPKLLFTYNKLVDENMIKKNNCIHELLRKRKIRTSSGIAAVAVLTKPYECPGKCLFCPTQDDVPKSYIDNEPAVMRAILTKYDAIEQIDVRLRGLEIAGNPADKIELIVMGGTFSYLPKRYQLEFIIGCFWACNKHKVKSEKLKVKSEILELKDKKIRDLEKILEEEQKKNERAKYRIVGLTLETRPDYVSKDELIWFRKLGCTRVEIGVQSIYERVLKINERGHTVKDVVNSTKLLKDAGFKINYHMMPNLYGSNLDKDVKMFRKLFLESRFQPDMLKIYPCMVTKYSPYLNLYKERKYNPYTDDELIGLIVEIKKNIPQYVRIQRLIRDIPAQNIIGSSKLSNLRQIINERYPNICKCIRCREIRNKKKNNVFIKRSEYLASGGNEIFLQYIDDSNNIYAMLRLRIPSCVKDHWIDELDNSAIIREVHTYGPMVQIGKVNKENTQHAGLGKKLLKVAEKITKEEFNLEKIAVISGVGVRGYYKKLGYKLGNLYMIKKLS